MIKEQMISLCNRKKVFSLTVVIYFSIYAASPLIYICAKQKTSECFSATKDYCKYGPDLHIFIYEFICSIDASKSCHETSNPITGILLLKKRTVLSEDKASTLINLSNMAELKDILMVSSDPSFALSMSSIDNSYENSPKLFSGLSPPRTA
jgi:hypothetical protein